MNTEQMNGEQTNVEQTNGAQMNTEQSGLNVNILAYEKIAWIRRKSPDGFYALIASPEGQKAVLSRYQDPNAFVFDYRAGQTREFSAETIRRFIQENPGGDIYFLQNFQDAVTGDGTRQSMDANLTRLNFSRDILSRLEKNIVFCVTPDIRKEISRHAVDFFSYFVLMIPFEDEILNAQDDYRPAAPPHDRSEQVPPPEYDDNWTREKKLYRAIAYSRQGKEYAHAYRYRDAVTFLETALKIRLAELPDQHPDTADTYNDIGVAYYHAANYPRALECFQNAMRIYETVLGKDHPSTAATYDNIAQVYYAQGDYPRALEWHQKALRIRETVLGQDHPDTAATYNNIAGVYDSQGDYPRALEWLQKALRICETVLGQDHPDTATTYNNIGAVYLAQENYTEALQWFRKALAVRLEKLGPEHPYTKDTQKFIEITETRLASL